MIRGRPSWILEAFLQYPVNTLSTVLAYDILFSLLDYYVILHWTPNNKQGPYLVHSKWQWEFSKKEGKHEEKMTKIIFLKILFSENFWWLVYIILTGYIISWNGPIQLGIHNTWLRILSIFKIIISLQNKETNYFLHCSVPACTEISICPQQKNEYIITSPFSEEPWKSLICF